MPSATVLLVEDNPAEVELIRTAFGSEPGVEIRSVPDGVEALAFLRKQGRHAGAPTPVIVLLDLGLPRKDGRAVLAEMKEDPALRTIPVIVLTGSRETRDILRAYDLHANAYLHKPTDIDDYARLAKTVRGFWIERNVRQQGGAV